MFSGFELYPRWVPLKDKCRVLMEYKSKKSYSKQRLGHCLDENYMEQ